MIRTMARAAVLLGWLVAGYFAFAAEVGGAVSTAMRVALALLLAVHTVEAWMLARRLSNAGLRFTASDLWLTLVFGIFHVSPRLAALPRERG